MQFNIKTLTLIIAAISLAGCNSISSKHIKCDDERTTALITQDLQESLNKSLEIKLKQLIKNGAIQDLDPAKLKLSAKSVQFNLVDSRTEYVDPDSPKTKCTIDLTTTIPSDVVKKADDARAKVNYETVAELAVKSNLDLDSNKIKLALEYTVQPTDKGDKVIVKLNNKLAMQNLTADILTSAFLKPQIEKNNIKSMQSEYGYNANEVFENAAVVDAPEYYEGE
ncbi:hypothetical protein EC844_12368 [Acinetobacter calcoaceticus]|uniref:Lipoprotein n=1 Tax=Acinetobacter calcoaceticus TaxID=471 RepID=A0A4R1XIX5_ACICA|nr:hypothetical protein EC844_12368 [Acinetobacter calcoaceticus]